MAARSQRALLSLRQNVRPNSRRTGLGAVSSSTTNHTRMSRNSALSMIYRSGTSRGGLCFDQYICAPNCAPTRPCALMELSFEYMQVIENFVQGDLKLATPQCAGSRSEPSSRITSTPRRFSKRPGSSGHGTSYLSYGKSFPESKGLSKGP